MKIYMPSNLNNKNTSVEITITLYFYVFTNMKLLKLMSSLS